MTIFIFAIALTGLIGRYTVLSGGAYWYFWKKNPDRFSHRKIQKKLPKPTQLRSELKWSLMTFLVFASGAALLYPLAISGRTKMYFQISEHGLAYFIGSIAILIVLHDAYFYFAHRFMHLKWVFKHVHRIHHQSTDPSPLAAFSFHPLEAIIEGLFIYGFIFVMPLHFAAVMIFLFYSHAMNVMGHLGYELFPKGHERKFPWSVLNSATHHNAHHKNFHGNYGLYFTFWDRVFGTRVNSEAKPRQVPVIDTKTDTETDTQTDIMTHPFRRPTSASFLVARRRGFQ